MEYGACHFKLLAQLEGVDEVAVMRESHASLYMVDDDRLRVRSSSASGRAVANVTDRHRAHAELRHRLRGKNVVHKPDILIRSEYAVVVHDNAAAFLPAVLEREESVICGGCDIGYLRTDHAENAAFFSDFCHLKPFPYLWGKRRLRAGRAYAFRKKRPRRAISPRVHQCHSPRRRRSIS